jgi:diacylglycerol kinase family enzyme
MPLIRRRKLSVVLNTTSGKIQQMGSDVVVDGLSETWERLGCAADITRTTGNDLTAALEEARDGPAEAVVVAGGDGTVAAAATVLAGHSKPLGILPLGTLNLGARDVGMPMDWKEAASLLVTTPEVEMDLLAVGDKLFMCIMVMGFYPTLMLGRPEYISTHQSQWGLVKAMGEWVVGGWKQDRHVIAVRSTEVEVHMTHKHRVAVMIDGELEKISLPFVVNLKPKALRVLSPHLSDAPQSPS